MCWRSIFNWKFKLRKSLVIKVFSIFLILSKVLSIYLIPITIVFLVIGHCIVLAINQYPIWLIHYSISWRCLISRQVLRFLLVTIFKFCKIITCNLSRLRFLYINTFILLLFLNFILFLNICTNYFGWTV